MTLSDDDMRRIEEEEYRKLARERLERTVRIEADIRTSGDQRVEVRGLGTEMYGDAKGAAKGAARAAKPAVKRYFAPLMVVIVGWIVLAIIAAIIAALISYIGH